MIKRRDLLKLMAAAPVATIIPQLACSADNTRKGSFKYALNTSTISGQNPGLHGYIEIAARTGYDGLELWLQDIKAYMEEGNTLKKLNMHISDAGLTVEGAIGFAEWIVDDHEQREKGFALMKEEMEIMAQLSCPRIAAPPAGAAGVEIDLFRAAERYRRLVGLGRQTGVKPLLEFWGASKSLFSLGQVLMVASLADDPDACILADVYHMFRGGSGFNGLKLLGPDALELFHMNDYPGNIPREEQNDSHRVYPGDGIAPLKEILTDLKNMGGIKVLSLELFNRGYWELDPLDVAATGLAKIKTLVGEIS